MTSRAKSSSDPAPTVCVRWQEPDGTPRLARSSLLAIPYRSRAAYSVFQSSIARSCHCQRKELRHQQNGPCTCHCHINDAPRHFFFGHVYTNKRKNVGCLRSLESDLLRNTQNSFGTSRFVLDKSWFGLHSRVSRARIFD